ncbi:hypothetical protein SAMN05421664_3513 [Chryseobacterium soldanellicola]|uniref:C1q domain-containing protein n=1 Tax=Chryseobacterium soldanellicola TaxID=311333 RepID=A0A1H1G8A1_9FLAO|nr:hypothetical protein [Chryseobacterium soldanellicola]SDR09431.1 hypothetical protein SAMN05421664_3513 [Chryseobacterium soldanellicola]
MKKIYKILLLIFPVINLYSQVGIGTSSPSTSAVLDITSTNKGALIPRLALIATNNKAPLSGNIPNGTLVFNTISNGTDATAVFPGVYQWNNGEWIYPSSLGEPKAKAVKFSNSASSTTNFNSATIAAPTNIDIFNTLSFNDDTNIFQKINDYQLKIKQAGLYLVSVNLALKQSPAAQASEVYDYIYFNLDGNLASSSIATLPPQYDPGKININGRFAFSSNSYVYANAGQILTLHSKRWRDGSAYNGTVNFDTTTPSSVTIIKLK